VNPVCSIRRSIERHCYEFRDSPIQSAAVALRSQGTARTPRYIQTLRARGIVDQGEGLVDTDSLVGGARPGIEFQDQRGPGRVSFAQFEPTVT